MLSCVTHGVPQAARLRVSLTEIFGISITFKCPEWQRFVSKPLAVFWATGSVSCFVSGKRLGKPIAAEDESFDGARQLGRDVWWIFFPDSSGKTAGPRCSTTRRPHAAYDFHTRQMRVSLTMSVHTGTSCIEYVIHTGISIAYVHEHNTYTSYIFQYTWEGREVERQSGYVHRMLVMFNYPGAGGEIFLFSFECRAVQWVFSFLYALLLRWGADRVLPLCLSGGGWCVYCW